MAELFAQQGMLVPAVSCERCFWCSQIRLIPQEELDNALSLYSAVRELVLACFAAGRPAKETIARDVWAGLVAPDVRALLAHQDEMLGKRRAS